MIKLIHLAIFLYTPVQALQILQIEGSNEIVNPQVQILNNSSELSGDLLLTKLEKSAKSGDARSQFSLANMYHNGIGVKTDEKLAFYWYTLVAEQGFASAQFNVANGYYHGIGTSRNLEKALTWYEKSAQQDFVAAQYNLAVMYRRGEGSKIDNKEAFYWYERAAQLGYGVAQLTLAKLYENGVGVDQNDNLAQTWYLRAANQYDPEAQFHLAEFHQKRNQYAQAVYYYRKASDQGHLGAQHALATSLLEGRGVIKDESKAKQLFLEAAEMGHAKSQLALGQLLLTNDQIIEAKIWLFKASEQQQDLATALLQDIEVLEQSKRETLVKLEKKTEELLISEIGLEDIIDPVVTDLVPNISMSDEILNGLTSQSALSLSALIPNQQQILDSLNSNASMMGNVEKLLLSAQQGNPIAQHNLSVLYRIGELVAKDDRKAFLLMQQSANQDMTRSQNSLALMYMNGIGVMPNYDKAYYWASASARKGDAEGQRILLKLVGGSL